jgi:hypothetical protein
MANVRNGSRTVAIEVSFSFNFAVVFDFNLIPVQPSKAKSIGDFPGIVPDTVSKKLNTIRLMEEKRGCVSDLEDWSLGSLFIWSSEVLNRITTDPPPPPSNSRTRHISPFCHGLAKGFAFLLWSIEKRKKDDDEQNFFTKS